MISKMAEIVSRIVLEESQNFRNNRRLGEDGIHLGTERTIRLAESHRGTHGHLVLKVESTGNDLTLVIRESMTFEGRHDTFIEVISCKARNLKCYLGKAVMRPFWLQEFH